jgi:hypothetical protein
MLVKVCPKIDGTRWGLERRMQTRAKRITFVIPDTIEPFIGISTS